MYSRRLQAVCVCVCVVGEYVRERERMSACTAQTLSIVYYQMPFVQIAGDLEWNEQ
jgi:hypothetical protein